MKIQNTYKIYVLGFLVDHHLPQWQLGLRHELSSPIRTLGSWVRIPLEAWMSVWVYSVFVLSCGQVVTLRRADPQSRVLPTL
jgi:hypothetical protein